MSHTEGPWYIGSDDATDCPCHKNSGLALVDTGRTGDWPIARLCEWNNVNLIAAAPDLLALAKREAAMPCRCAAPHSECLSCTAKKIIAKVEGAVPAQVNVTK